MRGVLAVALLLAGAAAAQEAPAEGWTLRAVPDGGRVAVGSGTGRIESLALFCLAQQPWLAITFAEPPEAANAEIAFGFSEGAIQASAGREESAGGAYVVALEGSALPERLAGRDSQVQLRVDGTEEGVLSLSGSTQAIRDALEGCHSF